MIKNLLTICLFSIILFCAGCSDQNSTRRGGKPTVFVSILPQARLAREIAGEHATIRVLVGEGQSPHTFEPTPRQMVDLVEARLLLTVGVPFEKQLISKIRPLCPNLKIAETQKGVPLIEMLHAHHDGECVHELGAKDPHIWLSPRNAITMAENMATALKEIHPEHAANYDKNLKILTDKLRALDRETGERLAPFKGNRFYVFHPAFGYFADAYGLQQIPIEMEGKAPSPRQLARLMEQAKADGVRIIFVQKQFPADSAKAIADAIGGKIIQLDPLAEDYFLNLNEITTNLHDAWTDE